MKYKDKENQILIFKFLKTNPLIPDYCKKNEYVWAVGKMTGGRFIPLMNFTDRKKALIVKNDKVKRIKNKVEAYWYRVGAIVRENNI